MFKYIDRRSFDPLSPNLLPTLAKENTWLIQRMYLMENLEAHRGCVNSVVWDDEGSIILSGSDDQHLVISDPWTGKTITRLSTPHRANIFSAKFVPNSCNQKIISCSGDGTIVYTDLNALEDSKSSKFSCNTGTCYDVLTLPGYPHVFLSCGEDGTVRWFDLRTKTNCSTRACHEDILLSMGRAVTAIGVNPINQAQLAVATPDSIIRIYDRRMLGTRAQDSYLEESNKALLMHLRPEALEGKGHRVTSLRYSSKGDQILASYSSDYLYLFDPQNVKDVPLDSASGETSTLEDDERSSQSGPTLKRLRLRGDWSDTGPQAVPESELRNQPGDVGQARPALQSTLMQHMTDILSRLLQSPNSRSTERQSASEAASGNSSGEAPEAEGAGEIGDSHFQSIGDIASDNVSSSGFANADGGQPRETNSAPPSIASPISGPVPDFPLIPSMDGTTDLCPPRLSDPSLSQCEVFAPEEESSPRANVTSDPELPSASSCIEAEENQSPIESMEVDDLSTVPDPNPACERDSSLAQRDTTEDLSRNTDIPATTPPQAEPSIGSLPPSSTETIEDSSQVTYEDMSNPAPQSPINDALKTTISGVRDTFSLLRDDFRHKHAVEPSVNITYSGQGTTSGLISLGVGDEIIRDYEGANHTRDSPIHIEDSSEQNLPATPTTLESKNSTENVAQNSATSEDPTDGHSSESADIGSGVLPPQSEEGACALPLSGSSSVENKSDSAKPIPSTSSSSGKRKSPRKDTTPPEVNETEEDSTTRHRSRLARINRAITRHVQQVRADEARRIDGPPDRTIPRGKEIQKYKGHRNARTMIKEVCFWGDEHVMSGSDCGRVFVWERKSGRLVMLWEADRHVVNCLQPHPYLPILATSGIDYDVKLWAPLSHECRFDEEQALEITRRNEALLAETRDTITVPATFMIRMLASLNQLRQGRNRNRNQNQEGENEDDDE